MSEFKVGDIVTFDRDYKIRNPGVVDGHWTVEDVVDPVWSSYSMVRLSQEGRCEYMSWTYDLVLVLPERSRMIFPFEEPPEECERGEFEYAEVFADPPDYMAMMADILSEANLQFTAHRYLPPETPKPDALIGSAMVVDFEDGRRTVGTLTGIGPVKYDGDAVVSCEVSFTPTHVVGALSGRTHGQSSVPAVGGARFGSFDDGWAGDVRVVNRASSGLRKQLPEYVPGSAGEAFNDIHKAIQRQIQKLMFDAYIPQRYWI